MTMSAQERTNLENNRLTVFEVEIEDITPKSVIAASGIPLWWKHS
jgi:hypothetical protein